MWGHDRGSMSFQTLGLKPFGNGCPLFLQHRDGFIFGNRLGGTGIASVGNGDRFSVGSREMAEVIGGFGCEFECVPIRSAAVKIVENADDRCAATCSEYWSSETDAPSPPVGDRSGLIPADRDERVPTTLVEFGLVASERGDRVQVRALFDQPFDKRKVPRCCGEVEQGFAAASRIDFDFSTFQARDQRIGIAQDQVFDRFGIPQFGAAVSGLDECQFVQAQSGIVLPLQQPRRSDVTEKVELMLSIDGLCQLGVTRSRDQVTDGAVGAPGIDEHRSASRDEDVLGELSSCHVCPQAFDMREALCQLFVTEVSHVSPAKFVDHQF